MILHIEECNREKKGKSSHEWSKKATGEETGLHTQEKYLIFYNPLPNVCLFILVKFLNAGLSKMSIIFFQSNLLSYLMAEICFGVSWEKEEPRNF